MLAHPVLQPYNESERKQLATVAGVPHIKQSMIAILSDVNLDKPRVHCLLFTLFFLNTISSLHSRLAGIRKAACPVYRICWHGSAAGCVCTDGQFHLSPDGRRLRRSLQTARFASIFSEFFFKIWF
jgi:hypothetical protein